MPCDIPNVQQTPKTEKEKKGTEGWTDRLSDDVTSWADIAAKKECLPRTQHYQELFWGPRLGLAPDFYSSPVQSRALVSPLRDKLNKPSFCSGSCDEIHATKLQKKLNLKTLDTSLKLFMKFYWNTLDTFFKCPWNFLKTSLKLPRNKLLTSFGYLEAPLNHP